MGKPLLVYLDSSDWSNLAASSGPEPFEAREKWSDVRLQLLAARDAGKAELRFSQPIIVEAYATSAVHHAQGLARARAISNLCGPLCLLEVNTLSRAEARRLAVGGLQPFDRTTALRDDGGWHPDPDERVGRLGAELLLDARAMVSEVLKTELPQLGKKKRRLVEDQIVDRNGRLAGPALARLRDPSVRRDMQAMVAAKLGLAEGSPNLETLAAVMAGEFPPLEADNCLIGLLRDPVSLFTLAPTSNSAEHFFGYLRAAGRSMSGPIAEAAATMARLVEEFGLDEARRLNAARPPFDAVAWREKLRTRLLHRLWEDERKRRGPGPRVRGEAWFKHVTGSRFGSIPALDSYLSAAAALMAKVTNVSRQPYRGRASDMGDVMHMAYLPYVDVFRCDRGSEQLARAAVSELGLGVQVATTIDDVLRRVEAE